ncbi:hypothetical protein KUTeg_016479 [Tegillarca granosa]|uniref:Ion transport domain-containing protein n=1 Tax=Tegillarca granosa TaxID=220873 RepID=A0ABQ9EL12_TEGGR|nr:hypothetical protein KUTeg_016479 [Tegillarca granosa]
MPLHSAVNSGDLKEDKSTPLHFACSQGNLEMVQLMHDMQPERFGRAVKAADILKMTPLHRAALFDHVAVVEYLVKQTAKENLLNQKDNMGCTPLHYASKEGHLVAIDDLIHLGAKINPKNNEKQSPLHFAARFGRYNTCKRLLESVQGPNIINETDGDGLSALHLAALNGNTKIINLLLQKGASVTSDHENNTPLHLAASSNYTRSMKLLLGVHGNLLDATNKNGDTALHLASKAGQTAAVKLLLTAGAAFTKNKENKSFIDFAIDHRHTDVALAVIDHDRFDFFGLYVVMFLEILRTLFRALCVFSMLIIAFGLAFYILLSGENTHAYSTPGLSLLRTAMMMLELDYMASFNEPYTDSDSQTLHFGGLTIFFLAIFVLLMPILLINLLIGLAVGDIESVQKNAKLKRLAMQIEGDVGPNAETVRSFTTDRSKDGNPHRG